jgi:hypothetical protein
MPCGGIFPVTVREEYIGDLDARCWQCSHMMAADIPASFCEEWDTFLHDRCIDAFLLTEEGRIVIDHGHEIVRRAEVPPTVNEREYRGATEVRGEA